MRDCTTLIERTKQPSAKTSGERSCRLLTDRRNLINSDRAVTFPLVWCRSFRATQHDGRFPGVKHPGLQNPVSFCRTFCTLSSVQRGLPTHRYADTPTRRSVGCNSAALCLCGEIRQLFTAPRAPTPPCKSDTSQSSKVRPW